MPEREDGESVTVPVNPFAGVTVMVEDPELPAAKVTDAGLAPSPKSGVPAARAETATVAK
jgi:hypothetical protein